MLPGHCRAATALLGAGVQGVRGAEQGGGLCLNPTRAGTPNKILRRSRILHLKPEDKDPLALGVTSRSWRVRDPGQEWAVSQGRCALQPPRALSRCGEPGQVAFCGALVQAQTAAHGL